MTNLHPTVYMLFGIIVFIIVAFILKKSSDWLVDRWNTALTEMIIKISKKIASDKLYSHITEFHGEKVLSRQRQIYEKYVHDTVFDRITSHIRDLHPDALTLKGSADLINTITCPHCKMEVEIKK